MEIQPPKLTKFRILAINLCLRGDSFAPFLRNSQRLYASLGSFLPAIRYYSEGRGIWFTVCLFVCQRFLDNPWADSCQSSHAGVLWFRTCLLPFWGLAAPGGRKKGQMKFSLLWESMENFCILAVFERYLSNACTDPHQILFV